MARQMFAQIVRGILQNNKGVMTVEVIADKMNAGGYRKVRGSQKGQPVDARYVAWGVVVYPDDFEVLVRLRK